MLFDDKPRNALSPKEFGEPLFNFLNRSSRPNVEALRSVISKWLADMREEDAHKLASQMASGADGDFSSGLTEL